MVVGMLRQDVDPRQMTLRKQMATLRQKDQEIQGIHFEVV